AYGARFGLRTVVVVPQGKIAQGKLAQAIVYGAKILAIQGNFDEALSMVRELSRRHPVALVNSLNPYRVEGQKTAAFEVVDELGDAPDYLFIPVGNAGNITAYWKGFKEYSAAGKAGKKTRMMGFQAEGAAPIVRGEVVKEPKTVASAIRIGNPASWKQAVAARDESGGAIDAVSDDEIMAAYRTLAKQEGVFGEPASAASVAGLVKVCRGGLDLSSSRVVCVVTGTGLKDVDVALKLAEPLPQLPAEFEAVEKALGWG
ncbi:MAG: threonine synthase, partial [Chloroflexota bacterium]